MTLIEPLQIFMPNCFSLLVKHRNSPKSVVEVFLKVFWGESKKDMGIAFKYENKMK